MKIRSNKNRSKYLIAVAILFAISLLAFLVYFLIYKDKNNDTPKTTEPSKVSTQNTANTTNSNEDTDVSSNDIPKENIPDSIDQSDLPAYTKLVENEKFKIRKLNNNYTITLYAIINNPSQYDAYRSQLKEYKTEALKYMSDKGIDTTKVKIDYEPQEASDL